MLNPYEAPSADAAADGPFSGGVAAWRREDVARLVPLWWRLAVAYNGVLLAVTLVTAVMVAGLGGLADFLLGHAGPLFGSFLAANVCLLAGPAADLGIRLLLRYRHGLTAVLFVGGLVLAMGLAVLTVVSLAHMGVFDPALDWLPDQP